MKIEMIEITGICRIQNCPQYNTAGCANTICIDECQELEFEVTENEFEEIEIGEARLYGERKVSFDVGDRMYNNDIEVLILNNVPYITKEDFEEYCM